LSVFCARYSVLQLRARRCSYRRGAFKTAVITTISAQCALLLLSVLAAPLRVLACDVCAIYTATEQRESRTGVWVGMAEQYTYFRTWQQNSAEVSNPGERLNSFITQFLLGYTFTPRFAVQLAVPFIAREFRRQVEQGIFENANVTGFGDMSL